MFHVNQTINLQVGVKAFVYNEKGEILLLKRDLVKYPTVNNPWDIPGGRINPESDLITNLNREIAEETGLKTEEPKLITAQDIIKVDLHVVRLTYLSRVTGGDLVLSDEHTEYKWLNPEEILKIEGLDSYVRAVLSDKRHLSFIKDIINNDRK
jgi:8-oxo-dGTP diphosphatase